VTVTKNEGIVYLTGQKAEETFGFERSSFGVAVTTKKTEETFCFYFFV
jgi:hypothetical protein